MPLQPPEASPQSSKTAGNKQQTTSEDACGNLESCGPFQALKTYVEESIATARDNVNRVVRALNTIPLSIHESAITTTKSVGVNVRVLGDSVAGAAELETTPVSKDNHTIILFLQSKYPQVYEKIQEFSDMHKKSTPEQRGQAMLEFNKLYLKPIFAS